MLRFNKSIQTDATEQTSALQDNSTQVDVELLNSGDSSTEALESQYAKVDIHPELLSLAKRLTDIFSVLSPEATKTLSAVGKALTTLQGSSHERIF